MGSPRRFLRSAIVATFVMSAPAARRRGLMVFRRLSSALTIRTVRSLGVEVNYPELLGDWSQVVRDLGGTRTPRRVAVVHHPDSLVAEQFVPLGVPRALAGSVGDCGDAVLIQQKRVRLAGADD